MSWRELQGSFLIGRVQHAQGQPLASRIEGGFDQPQAVQLQIQQLIGLQRALLRGEGMNLRPLNVSQSALGTDRQVFRRMKFEGEFEPQFTGLVGLEIGVPIVVGQPGIQGGLVRCPLLAVEAPEGVAADLPERRVRRGHRHACLMVLHPEPVEGGDVVPAASRQLFAVELDDRPRRLEVGERGVGQVERQMQVGGARRHVRSEVQLDEDVQRRLSRMQAVEDRGLLAVAEADLLFVLDRSRHSPVLGMKQLPWLSQGHPVRMPGRVHVELDPLRRAEDGVPARFLRPFQHHLPQALTRPHEFPVAEFQGTQPPGLRVEGDADLSVAHGAG